MLCQARAIENQLFVVSVNGCGKTGKLNFCGGSQIINPWGTVLDSAGDDEKFFLALSIFLLSRKSAILLMCFGTGGLIYTS